MELVIVELQSSKNDDKRAKAISKCLFFNKQKTERYLFSDQDEACYQKHSELFQKLSIWLDDLILPCSVFLWNRKL